jgi:hypothetical protein
VSGRVTVGHIAVICAFLLVAGAVFWPGLYRYSELKESTTGLGSTVTVLRTNRLTGKVETLDRQSGQWVGSTPAPRHATPQSLPAGEQAQVAGFASFRLSDENFSGKIYNGSRWTITRVIVRISTVPPPGIEITKIAGPLEKAPRHTVTGGARTRKFVIDVRVKPFSTSFFSIAVSLPFYRSVNDWAIEDVIGCPPGSDPGPSDECIP